ncbi:dethiobiotin synthase [Arsenophonus endosymbiont of Lipoptena cervi]|uniref:dethiobiotin synthase n=1 Tax=Arsenophonus endosymbiont of Lipoptena cervi TaxID=363258 RepID=UPI00376F29EE
MNKCFFITGTDTNVGKTIVSCAILQAANAYGYKTAGYKPVASGSEQLNIELRNLDAQLLKKNSSVKLNYNDVNPIVFTQATSPHIASELTGKMINWSLMCDGLHKLKKLADLIIIEGIGGWYTILYSSYTMADWVIKHQLPIILTIGIKLGCINHAILTTKAIIRSGLTLAGWIANEVILPNQYQQNYLKTLYQQIPAPCLGIIPHLPHWKTNFIGDFIKLDKIII